MKREMDLDAALQEAERSERGVVRNSRSLIRDMAERMATERRDKLKRSREALRKIMPRPIALPIAPAPMPALPPSPPLRVQPPLRPLPKLKSVQLLLTLKAATGSLDVPGLHRLRPGIGTTSIAAYMASFTARRWAIRTGTHRFYRYVIGPKGEQYLKTFHPPD